MAAMFSCTPSSEKKRVAVVGASFAGLAAARILCKEKNLDITVIDSRDHVEYTPSNHYAIAGVIPQTRNLTPLKDCIPSGVTFRQARVTQLNDGKLSLEDTAPSKPEESNEEEPDAPEDAANATQAQNEGKVAEPDELEFDGCLLCTGSTYLGPIRTETIDYDARNHEMEAETKKLKNAQRIVCMGAGLVGVELAAEIASRWPDKEVWLLDLFDRVLAALPEEASRRAAARLKELNVILRLGVRSRVEGNMIHFPNGDRLKQVDIIYRCFGVRAQTELVEDSRLKSKMGLTVEDDLHLLGYQKPIFAAGDVADLGRLNVAKTGYHAIELGELAAKNLIRTLQDKPQPTRTVQQHFGTAKAPSVVICSLGKGHAIIVLNDLVLGGSGSYLSRLLLGGKDFLAWVIKNSAKGNTMARIIDGVGHYATNTVINAPLIWRLFNSKPLEPAPIPAL